MKDRPCREAGAALVETILIGLLLLVPLIWGLGVLADLQRNALAATAAAREAGFEAARQTDASAAGRAIDRAVHEAFINHGLDPSDARVSWDATSAFERGGSVEIEVEIPVTVLQAPLIGKVAGPSVWVRASHTATIDLYRSRP